MKEYDYTRVTCAERLLQMMHEKHVSVAEVAAATMISQSTLYRYLKGKTKPKSNRIYILAQYFNVDEGWLWGMYSDERLKPRIPNDERFLAEATGRGMRTDIATFSGMACGPFSFMQIMVEQEIEAKGQVKYATAIWCSMADDAYDFYISTEPLFDTYKKGGNGEGEEATEEEIEVVKKSVEKSYVINPYKDHTYHRAAYSSIVNEVHDKLRELMQQEGWKIEDE